MKKIKHFLFGIIILMQSTCIYSSYHIICVTGPNEKIIDCNIKQKIFIEILKKLIKLRDPKKQKVTIEIMENYLDEFSYAEREDELLKKIIENKTSNLILMGIGKGQNIVENVLLELQVKKKEKIIKKILKITKDRINKSDRLLRTIKCEISKAKNILDCYIKIDLNEIDEVLNQLIKKFYKLNNKCCRPKNIYNKLLKKIDYFKIIELIFLASYQPKAGRKK
ncbi:hypothetical protein GF385_02305 [Candidatus Dependentiae bacterium]|nr:hypothetical protein [Candidatus Dependentiae bacterium]